MPTPSRPVWSLPSASYTTTQTSPDLTNHDARGISVVLDATVNAGGLGSVTLTIQGKDPVSGKYYTLLAGAAVITVVTNRYFLFPGAPVAANVSANDQLPNAYRIQIVANNANPVSYSVGAVSLA